MTESLTVQFTIVFTKDPRSRIASSIIRPGCLLEGEGPVASVDCKNDCFQESDDDMLLHNTYDYRYVNSSYVDSHSRFVVVMLGWGNNAALITEGGVDSNYFSP